VLLSPAEAAVAGSRYNVPMLNALVLHCGQVAIAATGGRSTPDVGGTPAAEVFGRLATELDHEGRYLLFNALANQLRYPNAHTHYFSCMILLLFGDATSEMVREQITRVLLERLIVNRPHPWGLLITFIELIKNPRLEFWSHSSTRSTPEIERLFESVSRSCAAPVSSTA
jgi:CCR4-NOT transcription complex subunit 1